MFRTYNRGFPSKWGITSVAETYLDYLKYLFCKIVQCGFPRAVVVTPFGDEIFGFYTIAIERLSVCGDDIIHQYWDNPCVFFLPFAAAHEYGSRSSRKSFVKLS